MGLTGILADYVNSIRYETAGIEVQKLVKDAFLDCFGCMLAGAHEIPVEIALNYVNDRPGCEEVQLIGRSQKTDVHHAAMLNGIAAHVHDFDDQLGVMNGHPSVPVMPVVLALGEKYHCSGTDILSAYMAGVEVCYLLSLAFNKDDRYYSKGWHTTSTFGVFAAAAAAAKLMNLSVEQMVHAFGIAASESSGLKGNFGTMTKSLHAGRAAEKGIFCAELASKGYMANPDIMEISEGFAYVSVGTPDMEELLAHIESGDSVFVNPGLNMKAWPCCKQNHSSINGLQQIMHMHDIRAEDIKKIICRVQPVAYDCLKYTEPVTTLQGKFSLQYNVALTALYGTVKLENFDGTSITDSSVMDFMKKIEMRVDDSIGKGKYNDGTFSSIVECIMKNGENYIAHIIDVTGDAKNRMSAQEAYEKFFNCAKRSLKEEKISGIAAVIYDLDKLADINVLIEAVNVAVTEREAGEYV